MDREFLIRAVSLYWPLLAAGVVWGLVRPGYWVRVGLLVAVACNMAALPFLNLLAQWMGWWSFPEGGPVVLGMPLELYLGWAVWWGVVLPLGGWKLAGSRLGWLLLVVMAVAAVVDVVAMPLMVPVLVLHEGWWAGELLLLAGALVPGMLGFWWTAHRRCLAGRVMVQGGAFGVLLFGVIPSVAAGGLGWLWEGLARPWWWSGSGAVLTLGFLGLGLAAAREFVVVGRGTPLPFDPTTHLVTSGVYRWVANPMQVSMVGMCVVWWMWFGLWWMLVLGGLGVVYSEGLARWSERGGSPREVRGRMAGVSSAGAAVVAAGGVERLR